ncbi:MAG TPA: CvpA family protein [Caulobacteraceae bacterium]
MDLTGFDFVAGAILLVSGLVGLARGATRELVTVIAFVGAVIASIFALRFSGPLAHHFIHTAWLASIAALLVVFIIVYVIVRLVGGQLTRGVRQTALSSLDRTLGFAIGLARGVVAVGVLVILIRAATPPERMPHWFTGAKVYPLANAAGSALRAFAPKGMELARRVAPTVEGALTPEESENGERGMAPGERPSSRHGNTDKERKALDDLVEKSR